MKAISFLGFNKKGYQETTYLNPLQAGEYTTQFVQEALVEFYKPDTLYVLLTNTAETGIPDNENKSTWETLKNRLSGKVDLQPITNVPEGHSNIETIADDRVVCNKRTNCSSFIYSARVATFPSVLSLSTRSFRQGKSR